MKRKKPSFNESYHGYRTFSELLEDAQKEGLLELETDKRSRTYVVTRFGSELTSQAPAPMSSAASPQPARNKRRRSSGRGRRRGGVWAVGNGNSGAEAAPPVLDIAPMDVAFEASEE